MKHEVKTWLFDIIQSIEEIESYFSDTPKRFEDYLSDTKTQRAVERNIEIIGEALSRILKETPEIAISDSRKIVDTRNRIIHGYDSVTADILWLIIQKSLPILQQEVHDLLK